MASSHCQKSWRLGIVQLNMAQVRYGSLAFWMAQGVRGFSVPLRRGSARFHFHNCIRLVLCICLALISSKFPKGYHLKNVEDHHQQKCNLAFLIHNEILGAIGWGWGSDWEVDDWCFGQCCWGFFFQYIFFYQLFGDSKGLEVCIRGCINCQWSLFCNL